MGDEEEYPTCPECGSDLDFAECDDCGGEGMVSRFEEDPLWYDEDDLFPCSRCLGKSGWWYCAHCEIKSKAPS